MYCVLDHSAIVPEMSSTRAPNSQKKGQKKGIHHNTETLETDSSPLHHQHPRRYRERPAAIPKHDGSLLEDCLYAAGNQHPASLHPTTNHRWHLAADYPREHQGSPNIHGRITWAGRSNARICNLVLWCERLPEHLLVSRMIFFPKKTGAYHPGEFRPISVWSVLTRLSTRPALCPPSHPFHEQQHKSSLFCVA